MIDDQLVRMLASVAGVVLVGAFREPLLKLLRRIGYTGWQ